MSFFKYARKKSKKSRDSGYLWPKIVISLAYIKKKC